ncbi:MAG: M20/M25/M40 family metallo-hydrolase [Patescibacteria group bacterium]
MPISNIIPLTKKLISIKTDPQNKSQLDEALNMIISELGDFTVEIFERNGSRSILAYYGKTRPQNFKVILNGHLDVIPGKSWQYEARIEGDKMYGVGSMDMKTNDSVMLAVFKDLAPSLDFPLGLQIVTDEEIGGFDGTKYQIEQGVKSDFTIAGEATNFNVVNRARGIILAKIISTGKTAHGAYPWRGENAVEKLISFLSKLKKEIPNPASEEWKTSLNIANIEVPNKSFNKIPDLANCLIDIRYIPEESSSILERLTKLASDNHVELKIVANESVLYLDERDYFIEKIQSASKEILNKNSICYGAFGTSDARFFTQFGMKGVEFGLIGGGIGTDQEWVSLQSAEDFYNILTKFLRSL